MNQPSLEETLDLSMNYDEICALKYALKSLHDSVPTDFERQSDSIRQKLDRGVSSFTPKELHLTNMILAKARGSNAPKGSFYAKMLASGQEKVADTLSADER